MMEVWRDIHSYEGYYQISSCGRVKSLSRYRSNGIGGYIQDERILKQTLSTTGYMKVELCKEGTRKSIKVHRLVAMAFLDNTNNKPVVNHKDGNQLNNHLLNLEWCTTRENVIHALSIGLKKTFSLEKDVLIELYIDKKFSMRKIGDMYDVSQTTIKKQLANHNIRIRKISESKVKYNITKELLDFELMHNSQLELAKKIGCDVSLISYYYNLFKKRGA